MNRTTDMSVAIRLREARQRLFKSASAAAESLMMSASTVRAHENGQNGVSVFDLERYARRYGVNVEWLLTGKGQEEVNPTASVDLGDFYFVSGVLQDGAWLPDDDENSEWPGWGWEHVRSAAPEHVAYSDTRFPPEIIDVMKVRTSLIGGAYSDGDLVFLVDRAHLGYRDGDHVVVIRERRGFVEWTLRKVRREDGSTWFDPLISEDTAFPWSMAPDETSTHVVAVVVACLSRRPVPALTIEDRRYIEENDAPLRRKEWRRLHRK